MLQCWHWPGQEPSGAGCVTTRQCVLKTLAGYAACEQFEELLLLWTGVQFKKQKKKKKKPINQRTALQIAKKTLAHTHTITL